MNRLEELTLRFCDGELSRAESAELERLLRDDAAAARFRSTVLIEGELWAAGRDSASTVVADSVLERLRRDRCGRTETAVMTSLRKASPTWLKPAACESASLWGWSVGCLAVAVAVLLLLGFGWHVWHQPGEWHQPDEAVFIATLSINGNSEPLQAGRVITTVGNADSGEIEYADGTHVEILDNSKVVVEQDSDGRKRLTVVEGAVRADVAPQPAGRPMMINTPTATLEVLGTSFGVESGDFATQLDVASGRVSMTRKIDGKRIEVAAGQFAKASKSADESLSPLPLPKLPDTWSEDFAAGLPDGWQAGRLIASEEGNAVWAAPDGHGKENNVAVTTHNAWREGQHALAQLHNDSVLKVRFRQDAPAPLRIMLVTRAYPREGRRFGKNFFYEDDSWNSDLPRGQWRTISVPLSEASYTKKRGNIDNGPEPVDGLAVFMLQVTTLEQDVGLTVDRMWISRE